MKGNLISAPIQDRSSRQVVQSYIFTTAIYDFNVYEKRVLYNLVKLAQSQIEGVRLSIVAGVFTPLKRPSRAPVIEATCKSSH